MTFLATTVVAVGSASVLGGRLALQAVARQEAVSLASQILDSIAVSGAPGTGTADADGYRVHWEPDAGGVRVWVTAGDPGPTLVTLHGAVLPTIPTLGDSAQAAPQPPSARSPGVATGPGGS